MPRARQRQVRPSGPSRGLWPGACARFSSTPSSRGFWRHVFVRSFLPGSSLRLSCLSFGCHAHVVHEVGVRTPGPTRTRFCCDFCGDLKCSDFLPARLRGLERFQGARAVLAMQTQRLEGQEFSIARPQFTQGRGYTGERSLPKTDATQAHPDAKNRPVKSRVNSRDSTAPSNFWMLEAVPKVE